MNVFVVFGRRSVTLLYILSDTDMKNGGFRDLLGVEKVRKCVVKIEKKNLTWAPLIVWKRKTPSPFRASVKCSHNKPS